MKRGSAAAAILIIFVLGLLFQVKYIDDFPTHTHGWAQSDRYALALGFVDNNLNFFKPQTFVLNKQFPDNWETPYNQSITAVEFPLHDFVPAVIMKITGNNSFLIFRFYILLYSFLGLFFLFKISMLLSGSRTKSLFVLIFAATSPVFVYYQSGFLPTIPSLTNAIIGTYFYLKYLLGEQKKQFNLSVCFFTLAALSRTTFAIPLIAMMGVEFLRILQKKTALKHKIVPVLVSISIIGFYYLYNAFLRSKYGSIFLSEPMPAQSWQHFVDVLNHVAQKWLTQYFSMFHYVFLAIAIFLILFYALKKQLQRNNVLLTILFYTSVVFLGSILFSVLMIAQFTSHDYYFIDTFYLPVMLLLIVLLAYIPVNNFSKYPFAYTILFIMLVSPLFVKALMSQIQRHTYSYWNKTSTVMKNFEGAAAFLDSVEVLPGAKILVPGAKAPNIPFIQMERKGYAIMRPNAENIERALEWDFDYMVFQNDYFFNDVYKPYPEILNRIVKIADNGKISLCVLRDSLCEQSLAEFWGFETNTPFFSSQISFENQADTLWQNINYCNDQAYSGLYSGLVTSDMEYGISFKTNDIDALRKKISVLRLRSFVKTCEKTDFQFVVTVYQNNTLKYYKAYTPATYVEPNNEWQQLEFLYQLPRITSSNYTLAVYIWNRGLDNFWIDDYMIDMY